MVGNTITTYSVNTYFTADSSLASIFNFSTFISALAILVIVYTITDPRYKFRMSITRLPIIPRYFYPSIYNVTFYSMLFIGFGTLITDLVNALDYQPPYFMSRSICQALFGFLFLFLVAIWIYKSAIKPTIFSKINYEAYFFSLNRILLRGSKEEMAIIANELYYSAKNFVKLVNYDEQEERYIGEISYCVRDLLLLIGNRKFSHQIIINSPITAAAIFKAISDEKKYYLPVGQFARNITSEAICDKDSFIYHEDDLYSSGLVGYAKPISTAIYGDYKLIDALKLQSPFDIDYSTVSTWDSLQLKAFSRCLQLTLESFLQTKNANQNSYVLNRALSTMVDCTSKLYELNNDAAETSQSDEYQKLVEVVKFIKKTINLLDEHSATSLRLCKVPKNVSQYCFYDAIADQIFDTIHHASSVNTPKFITWMVQHNTIWTNFFWSYGKESQSLKLIQFKLRRILYNEITFQKDCGNYKSASILGFLLNVMGLTLVKSNHTKSYFALHKAILKWTQKNFIRFYNINQNVMKRVLVGNLTFDKENSRLVKTYDENLRGESSKAYLNLEVPDSSEPIL